MKKNVMWLIGIGGLWTVTLWTILSHYGTELKNLSLNGFDSGNLNKERNVETQIAKSTDSKASSNSEHTFLVFQNQQFLQGFTSFVEATKYAKRYKNSTVYYENKENMVWENKMTLIKAGIEVPLISQLPELPRGCEVTSLAMLLQSAGVTVDKMKLAKDVRKDPTPYTKKNGQVYFGNPYDGFVGDMYSFENPGYGVYHGPIKELADQYLPSKIIDMTGSSFSDVLFSIQRGAPVWVITNTTFSPLSDSRFQTWVTPTGTIQITYKEHAVLVTGFDSNYIYFNDPLANKNRKVAISSFQASWEQMGRQAITYITS